MSTRPRAVCRTKWVLPCAVSLAALWPNVAQADDDFEIVFAVVGVSSLVGSNITFTAYSGGTAARVEEPDFGWMTAQSIVTSPQALAINGAVAAAAADDDDEGYTLPLIPVAAWLNALSVHAVWTVGAPESAPSDARFGVSWLAGTNAAFTAAAFGALADERTAPLWVSIPQVGLMGAEVALTSIRAAQDEKWRGGWAALAAWSGVLTIHGIVSVAGEMAGWNDKRRWEDELPMPESPEDPDFDPQLDAPLQVPPPPSTPPPLLVPAPVGDGASMGPGVMLMGSF